MKLRILVVAATLTTLANAEGWATPEQPPAPAAPASSSSASSSSAPAPTVGRQPEVIIKGTAELAPKISAFVKQITAFNPNDPALGMARWQESVCPLVSGLSQREGDFILGRVSEIARAADVPLAGEHCRANLFILVNREPQALLRAMDKRNPVFTFGAATPSVIDHFIETPRAVRVWYHHLEKTPEGLPLLTISLPQLDDREALVPGPGGIPIAVPNPEPLPGVSSSGGSNIWAQASHLTLNTVWTIYRVFVVVDLTELQGVSLGQLADYAAMVGLAEVSPSAHLGDAPTILTLFDRTPQSAAAGMTDWDRAFLKAWYASEQKSKLQRSEIALEMVHDIAH